MKACLCARGKDLNAQLQVENSIFPKFGRSRGSEKLTSIAKHKTNGTLRESEAIVVGERGDKKNKNSNNICVKTTTTIPAVTACNNATTPDNNKKINGFETTNCQSQRTPVLHTDL
jgi:allatostatin C receptor